ncbi:MAG: DUF2520 domain-containing protein, partial [Pyrinomonadaceae bacterium]
MVRISIVGIGRVGGAIALSLPRDKYSIENLIYRGSQDAAEEINNGGGRVANVVALDELPAIASDIIFITTQDSEISSVAVELANKIKAGAIVYHTSGSLSSAVLEPLRTIGCKTGSIHPLVSISRSEVGPVRFRNAFFCVEGGPDAVDTGKQVVLDLGGRPFSLDTKFKTLYHAAAVTACG